MAYIDIPTKDNNTPLTPTEFNYLIDKLNARRLRDLIDVEDLDAVTGQSIKHNGSGWVLWDIQSEHYTKNEINNLLGLEGEEQFVVNWGEIGGSISAQNDLFATFGALATDNSWSGTHTAENYILTGSGGSSSLDFISKIYTTDGTDIFQMGDGDTLTITGAGVSFDNTTNTYTITGGGGSGSATWETLTGNQSTINLSGFTNDSGFITAAHNHDADYAPLVHNHDADYAPLVHNHDADYAPLVHSHDDLYYTETEMDTLLSGKSDTTHTHAYLPLAGGTLTGKLFGTDVELSGDIHATEFHGDGSNLTGLPSSGISHATSDGQEYVSKNGAWAVATGGGIEHATSTVDGYISQDGAWVELMNNANTYGQILSKGGWLRSPSAGFLPDANNSASLGSASWNFSNTYSRNVYLDNLRERTTDDGINVYCGTGGLRTINTTATSYNVIRFSENTTDNNKYFIAYNSSHPSQAEELAFKSLLGKVTFFSGSSDAADVRFTVDSDKITSHENHLFLGTATGIAPTADLHLATKKYVDDNAVVGGTTIQRIDLSTSTTQDAQTTHNVTWNSNNYKDSAAFTHSTSSNSHLVTVLSDGLFMVNSMLLYDNNYSSRKSLIARLYINGVLESGTTSKDYSRGSSYGYRVSMQITKMMYLSANDTVHIEVVQSDSDGSGTVLMIPNESSFQITQFGSTESVSNVGDAVLANSQEWTGALNTYANSNILLTGTTTGLGDNNIQINSPTGYAGADTETILSARGLVINIDSPVGGWARRMASITVNDVDVAQFGSYGNGTVFRYSYWGAAYNNAAVKLSEAGNMAIGLSSVTLPNSSYKLYVYGAARFSGSVTGIAPTSDLHFATKKYVDDNSSSFSGVLGTVEMRDGLGFLLENGAHGVTYNDGAGNFSIRVGNEFDSTEKCTEDGYVFHDEWSQSSAYRQFNISSASLTVGDNITWRTQGWYDQNSFYLGYQGTDKIKTSTYGIEAVNDGWYCREENEVGGLMGGYNNDANNASYTNPIYVIGSSYTPNSTTLSNMYGIGYCGSAASFINTTDLGTAPQAGAWGMYVSSDGNARIFLDGSNGETFQKGTAYAADFYENSDERLKKDIKSFGNGLFSYVLKSDKDEIVRYGTIAQDIEKELPEVVKTDKEGMKTVNYTSLLTKKLIEANEEIETLKAQMAAVLKKLS